VAEEKRFNLRLRTSKSVDEFVGIMSQLTLAYPRRIDEAVPANMASGVTEPDSATPSREAADRWAPVARTPSGVPVIAPAWVAEHASEARLIDVREHLEFCGPIGHIESAELVPLAGLAKTAADWSREQPIVTICTYGTRSGNAAEMLSELGFQHVASLHGGMIRWAEEGHPAVEILGDRATQDAAAWQGMDI
jgi:rhodanese-related sulfurtransferase